MTSLVLSSGFMNQQLFAQEHQRAHIGLIYPLSTNGTRAAQISNTISLHALAGVSAGEDGAAISGLATIIKGDQRGVVISGLANTIAGAAKGAQVAGLLNVVKGHSKGIAAAGLINMARSAKGLEAAGLLNIAKEQATVQAAGLSNVAGTAEFQVAGLGNIAKTNNGVQIAGLINTAAQANGQIAGLINIAQKVKGVQIAGLINIAAESDYPIGFLNFIKNGAKQIGASIDESGNAVLALRTGGKYTYGIMGAGYNVRMDNAPYVMEAGLGFHIPVSKLFRVNLEVSNTANTNFKQDAYYKSSFRPLLGLTLGKHLEIVAGPSFNYVNYMSGLQAYRENTVYNFFGAQATNSLFFGGFAGIHFTL
ncbi:MAG: hypothetical protein BGO31_06745 [Bacteroidetes bacterium 43-16]|nr:MAG: hypothetical protein BGO31_06745 [Bacteroidetes bacterium 43-16]